MPELSDSSTMASDGTERHLAYPSVKVADIPIDEPEERIRKFLRRYEARAQVSIDSLLSVSVSGEVRLPNLYSLPPELPRLARTRG